MALNITTNIVNTRDGYLLDSKNVKGTYIVVQTQTERDALPTLTRVPGTLCYVVASGVTYRWLNDQWNAEGSVEPAIQEIQVNGVTVTVTNKVAMIPLTTTITAGTTTASEYTEIASVGAVKDYLRAEVTDVLNNEY